MNEPAPDAHVWQHTLRWIEGARMQMRRLEEAVDAWATANADARMRSMLNDGSQNSRTWIALYDTYPRYDPRRPIGVPTVALWMQVTTEADLLLVAIRNVLRGRDRLPQEAQPTLLGDRALRLMRDIGEHFDDIDGRSFRDFAENYGELDARGFAFTKHEIVLGGTDGVPLSQIREWLAAMRSALTGALTSVHAPVADDLTASAAQGDDELEWPPERLRYHWARPIGDGSEGDAHHPASSTQPGD